MSNLSLNKAAHLLGCNELNKFDYKSLVSIRKLAKTLGCNEYDLMKGFEQNGPKSSDTTPKKSHEKFSLLRSKKIFSTKAKSKDYERAFKRIIVNRKLPSKYARSKKSHTQEINESLDERESEICEAKADTSNCINHHLKSRPKREVILYKDEHLGFGFIAGSEKPLKIRFVTPNGPGSNKLLNGDEILAVNDEDVEFASRNYVINLIRSCSEQIKLLVKQPTPKSNNSLLLTEDKKALKKEINSNKKIKVRFRLEGNAKEIIESNEEILNEESIDKETIKIDLNLENSECILKVNLENQNVKSFKYDQNTTVKDVLQCLKEKLSIKTIDYFGIVVRLPNEYDCVSKYILIDEMQYLFTLREKFGKNFICMLRFVFIPSNYRDLIANDMNAFKYLYEQSVNDVLKEKYASEIKYEMILHLTTLSILYDLYDVLPEFFSNNFEELDIGRYLPKSIVESNILPKEDLKKLLIQNLSWFMEKTDLIQDKTNIKMEYLSTIKELFQFSGRIFFVFLIDQMKEAFIIIGADFGIATFVDIKTKKLMNLAQFDSIENIRVSDSLDLSMNLIRVDLDLFETMNSEDDQDEIIKSRTVSIGFLRDDYLEFLYILQGYLRLVVFPKKNRICPIQEIKSCENKSLNVPVYLVKHPCKIISKKEDENQKINNALQSINTGIEELRLVESCNELKKNDQPLLTGLHLKEALHKELMDKFKTKNSETKKDQLSLLALSAGEDNPVKYEDNRSDKSFKIVQEDEDSKSISSIEGSLKGISSSMDQNSTGLNSSTPLIHMYPNIEDSKINETIAWKSVCLQQLTVNSNFANLNYELDMNCKSQFEEDSAPTLVQNFSFNSHFDFDLPNFDVIDLTQSINKDLVTAPPPPEQFSDDYQLNEFKTCELEIESGIESDSSSDHNNLALSTKSFSSPPPAPPPLPSTPAPVISPRSIQDQTPETVISNQPNKPKTYSSQLVINLDNSKITADSNQTNSKHLISSDEKKIKSFRLNPNLKRSNSFMLNMVEKSQALSSLMSSSSSSSSGVSSSSSSPTSKPLTHSLSVKNIAKKYETAFLSEPRSVVKIINHNKAGGEGLISNRLKSLSVSSHDQLVKRSVTAPTKPLIQQIQILPNQSQKSLLDILFTDNQTQNQSSPRGVFRTQKDQCSIQPTNIAFSHDSNLNNLVSKSVTDRMSQLKSEPEQKKSKSLNSFHKMFNRIVEHKAKKDEHKFEPINGYDDLYSSIKKNERKSSLSYKSIESKLSRKASASYSSIYNSLPSRNFRSLLDLFRGGTKNGEKNFSLDDLTNTDVDDKKVEQETRKEIQEEAKEEIIKEEKEELKVEDIKENLVEEKQDDTETEISVPILSTFKAKKSLLKDPTSGKSSLKVRWKDSIEISNILIEKVDDSDNDECVNDIYDEFDDELNSDSDESIESSDLELNSSASKLIIDKKASREIETAYSNIEQFNLKPLHKMGAEFESEMADRVLKLEKIAQNTVDLEGENGFSGIYADLESVSAELHSTIEHVRLSSMVTSEQLVCDKEISREMFRRSLEDNMNEIAVTCREFVHSSKTMISSALIDDDKMLSNVRSAMNSLSLLVKVCFQICFEYMYKNEKLDQIRQLLIQILNLLNTFRNTLNITFLAASKQLNDTQMDLLIKQAHNLADEISQLIQRFKLIY